MVLTCDLKKIIWFNAEAKSRKEKRFIQRSQEQIKGAGGSRCSRLPSTRSPTRCVHVLYLYCVVRNQAEGGGLKVCWEILGKLQNCDDLLLVVVWILDFGFWFLVFEFGFFKWNWLQVNFIWIWIKLLFYYFFFCRTRLPEGGGSGPKLIPHRAENQQVTLKKPATEPPVGRRSMIKRLSVPGPPPLPIQIEENLLEAFWFFLLAFLHTRIIFETSPPKKNLFLQRCPFPTSPPVQKMG